MQFIKTLVRLFFLFVPCLAISQTTYLPQGDKANILLDRLEILGRSDSLLNFSKTKPFARKHIVNAVLNRLNNDSSNISPVDHYNIASLFRNNNEYIPAGMIEMSRKSIGKFYRTPANLYEVNIKDFYMAINPVIQYVVSKESDNDEHIFLNTRGVSVRGMIANKIGFAAYITDNQERDPLYVQRFEDKFRAVPGAGFYKDFKNGGYDYFDARGYFTFNVTKYIDVAFGYDKNFIGNGYRSLFLSDFSNSALFLKLNTRIWRLNYQNLFMELHPSEIPGGDKLLPKKYAAFHHLDLAITKWLNVGVFEGVVFGRKDRFEFSYLNPVIFYRSIEAQNGSFDNSVVGIDAKANLKYRVQLYGQLLLDEFLLSEVRADNGWWGNKTALQIGAKAIDLFGVKNLDLQLEVNRVRPFTYSHRDSVGGYSHYNQPLAHPLGANFREVLGILRYQPKPKWMAELKLIRFVQGVDSSSRSFGGNILLPNIPPFRIGDYGYANGTGQRAEAFLTSFLISYEWKENLFFELSALMRKYELTTLPVANMNSTIISAGVRWNMHRRSFDF